MNPQDIQKHIDRVVGTDGTLRIPSWWMHKILSDIVRYCEEKGNGDADELRNEIYKGIPDEDVKFLKENGILAAVENAMQSNNSSIYNINERINALESRQLVIISNELPANPKSHTIYLVPTQSVEENNVFVEWIYTGGSWEKLGEFKADVNLSEYAKKDEVVFTKDANENICNDFEKHSARGEKNTIISSSTNTFITGDRNIAIGVDGRIEADKGIFIGANGEKDDKLVIGAQGVGDAFVIDKNGNTWLRGFGYFGARSDDNTVEHEYNMLWRITAGVTFAEEEWHPDSEWKSPDSVMERLANWQNADYTSNVGIWLMSGERVMVEEINNSNPNIPIFIYSRINNGILEKHSLKFWPDGTVEDNVETLKATYDDTEIRQEFTELSAEVDKCNVGAVDTDDSVEEPEIPSSEGNEEMLRILAGNSPNLIWEDIYGKIHYEVGELKSRKAQNDSTFRTTCRKLISCIPDTTSHEWAFLFGVQTEVGVIEEVYPYIFNSAKLTSLNFAFSGAPNIKDWGFLKHLDTSKITTMSGVFYKSEADIIDVSNWDVSNTTILGNNASYSFFGKIKKVIGLENWDTSNVQKMIMLLSGAIEDYSGVKNWNVQNCSNFKYILHSISATDVDVSLWQIQDGADMESFTRNSNTLVSFGMPNVPTGATTTNFGRHLTSLQNITMRTDALIYASLYFNESPLTAESVKTLLSHLAETPDEGATITFKNGLYAGYSAEDKAEIDALRNTATTNGWTIVNMG